MDRIILNSEKQNDKTQLSLAIPDLYVPFMKVRMHREYLNFIAIAKRLCVEIVQIRGPL